MWGSTRIIAIDCCLEKSQRFAAIYIAFHGMKHCLQYILNGRINTVWPEILEGNLFLRIGGFV